jgi:pimeloyl-ACP methyl ester carboxylesterase
VLLIGHDASGVDDRLREHLEASGVALTIQEADDYFTMTRPPQNGLRPWTTIARSTAWVNELGQYPGQPAPAIEAGPVPEAVRAIDFMFDGQLIRESIREFATPSGRTIGILAEPAVSDGPRPCLVAINAAVMRCTGPSRLNVEITRDAAASGFPALRLDLPGIGDSDGTEVLPWQWGRRQNARTLAALSSVYDALQIDSVASTFVGVGLSLGAYTVMRSALSDERVVAIVAINMNPLKWVGAHRRRIYRTLEPGLDSSATPIGRLCSRLPKPASRVVFLAWQRWRIIRDSTSAKLARSRFRWIVRFQDVLWAPRVVRALGKSGAQVYLVYGKGEFSWELMQHLGLAEQLGRWPSIDVATLDSKDHILRPLWVQDFVRGHVASTLSGLSTVTERRQGGRPA